MAPIGMRSEQPPLVGLSAALQLRSLAAVEGVAVTFIALSAAALAFGLFVLALGVDPLGVYAAIHRAAFGSWFAWQNTLSLAAPLMLSALCTALPARLGLVVIGGEGAILLGGLAAAVSGLVLAGAPASLVIPAMMALGLLSGGIWIGICGALRHYRGVNETISSLLLVYLAATLFDHFIDGPLRDPKNVNFPATRPISDAYLIAPMPGTDVHYGLLAGVVACIFAYLFIRHTVPGFAIRIAGGNPKAARMIGLPVGHMIVAICIAGGAAAGLAGAFEVTAVHGRASGALHAGYGYMGILVAFLARHNPLAIIPAAVLTGGVGASSGLLQRLFDLPGATAAILQGFVFLSILISETLYGRLRLWPRRA